MHKYGRDFSASVMDNTNNSVSDRVNFTNPRAFPFFLKLLFQVLRKTDVSTPSTDLVDAYLTEIAKGYSISWSANPSKADDTGLEVVYHRLHGGNVYFLQESSEPKEKEASAVDERPSGKNSTEEVSLSTDKSSPTTPPSEDDFDALAKRFAALKKR